MQEAVRGTPIISARELRVRYGEREILHGLDFDICHGETVVILGGSGSGKSTLLRTIVGLEKPHSGEILVKGTALGKASRRELSDIRKKMGLSFQGGALIGSLTVGENIALPLLEHSSLAPSTVEVMVRIKLEQVGLSGFENFNPSQLSGGMKKRAAFARALALDPEMLFFDEPSAGLDPIMAAGIDNLILNLKSAYGITMVIVTHELASAFLVADRIMVVDKGTIIADDTPHALKESSHPRVRQFLDRVPDSDGDDDRVDHLRLYVGDGASELMGGTGEKALVGVFVILAAALLFVATMALTGGIGVARVPHSAYFGFSGGLESGAPVRYAGLNVGKVTRVRVDPSDTTRIEIDFTVNQGTPIRTDSVARVSSMGLLSDNFLEISAGMLSAARAAPGSVVKSKEAFGFDQIGDAVQTMLPDAQASLKSLNTDLDSLHTTIGEATDLLNEKNRANLAATLSTLNGALAELRPELNNTLKSVDEMLADFQPRIDATLTNVQALTVKLDPLLDNLNKTVDTANTALANVDSTLSENRPDIRASVETLRQVLEKATILVGQLNSTLNQNSDDIDETLDNVRLATENLRQFTDTLKTSPTSLIRGTGVKDRKPGGLSK